MGLAYSSMYAWMRSLGSGMSVRNFMPGVESRSVVYLVLFVDDIAEVWVSMV
jgi:hypothetical protein